MLNFVTLWMRYPASKIDKSWRHSAIFSPYCYQMIYVISPRTRQYGHKILNPLCGECGPIAATIAAFGKLPQLVDENFQFRKTTPKSSTNCGNKRFYLYMNLDAALFRKTTPKSSTKCINKRIYIYSPPLPFSIAYPILSTKLVLLPIYCLPT